MLEDRPLFEPALAGIMLHAVWHYPDGWSVRLSVKREGLAWEHGEGDHYDHLSTDEALDVMAALVDRLKAQRPAGAR